MMRTVLVMLIVNAALPAANSGKDAIPLFFIENQGQAPSAVRFLAKGSGLTAHFASGEAVFHAAGSSVRVRFEGSSPAALEGLEPLPGHANFLTGGENNWRVGVPLYGGVVYRGLYPGVNMVYGGGGRDLKSEFLVAPGADASRIRMRYVGAGELRIDERGALVIPLNGGDLREEAPAIYQVRGGRRVAVAGGFALTGGDTVSFAVGDYDASLPLVIDPVLSYSTLLGGSGFDTATALAVDSTGAAYVAGYTDSYNFPTANPVQNSSGGGNDVFVAKLNAAGNGLVYCTYVGGSGDDRAYGIALDASGAAYVTGSTASKNFPVRNALQAKLAGGRNAFVLKLAPTGNSLVFSTYLGGSGSDVANGIAVDAAGSAYVVGDATSLNFPATGFQKGNRGGQDAFVAKLSSDGTRLVYSTYLGGGNTDHGSAIAVDTSGSAYVTGSTWSSDFPVASAFRGTLAGGQDAFVTRLGSDGSTLLFSTYLGGSGGSVAYPEAGQGIALDTQGNAYVAGVTSSTDFPVLHPFAASLRGWSDAFVSKLSASGGLVYSTYLGGSGVDFGNAVAVDSSGSAYIAGCTYSSDLPVFNAVQSASGGDYDAFLAKLSATGDSILYLSYLGGSGSDTATAVALDPSANIYVAGYTLSTNFPLLNAYQSTNAGNYGAFVAKMSIGSPPAAVSVTPSSGSGMSQTFVFQFSAANGAASLATVSVVFNSTLATSYACAVTYNGATNALSLLSDTGALPGSGIVPGSGSQQNSQCSLNGAGSSVSRAGTVLTLSLALTFQAAFKGAKNVYMDANDGVMDSGWQQRGSWTVPAGLPSAVSVTPASGSGSTQTFSFLFSDGNGYSAISSTQILINTPLSASGSCYVFFSRAANTVYLANDAGTAWGSGLVLGQSGTLQNSQCAVSGAGSSASGSGNNLTLNLALTFQSVFTGTKGIYMEAYESAAADSGWQQCGSWTITAGGSLSALSVTPSSGSGSSQTFAFLMSDSKGYAAIASAQVLINGQFSVSGGCYVYINRAAGAIYLANDAGTAWTGPVVAGQSGTLQNSQCTVSGPASSLSGSGSNLTLNLALTFQAAFAGAKGVYLEVYEGPAADTGWQQKGTWTVSSASQPEAVSVTPSSGSGSSQTFSFLMSDAKGFTAIASAQLLINGQFSTSGGCYLFINRAAGAIYLTNDAATAWTGPVVAGQSGTLQNSQCGVSAAGSSISGSGSNLTVNLALTFQAAFKGSKGVYMEVYEAPGADSGWQQRGSWTPN